MALFDSYTTANSAGAKQCRGSLWSSQGFTPSTGYTITSVKINISKSGSPTGNINIAIKAADANHKPTGADLCTGSIAVSGVGSSAWHEITLGAGSALTASTEYTIVISLPDGDTTNRININGDNAGSYSGGLRCYSSNSGSTWTAESAVDHFFETYGTAAGWSHIAKVNGVAQTSIAKVNNVAKASISKVNGTAV